MVGVGSCCTPVVVVGKEMAVDTCICVDWDCILTDVVRKTADVSRDDIMN